MKLKFDSGSNHRYIIGYWPAEDEKWSYISDFIDTKENFEGELLNIIDTYELEEGEDFEDICVFKLIDTPSFNITQHETKNIVRNIELK